MIEESLMRIIQYFSMYLKYDTIKTSKTQYEFQITNCNNIALTIRTHEHEHADYDINKFISHLTYFKINNNVIKNDFMYELFFNNYIIRSACSFHQNDNNIRVKLYHCIINDIKYVKNMYYIGGEMYLFGKILNDRYEFGYFYSDFESIILDCYMNNNYFNNEIFLVDYTNCELFSPNDNDTKCVIINIGKNGIRKHLCNELIRLNFDTIFIISCHEKNFTKDYDILKAYYKICKYYSFTTNYTINLFVLETINLHVF